MNWRKILIGTWSWKRPFYSIGAIYLLLLCVALFAADKFIFQPPDYPYPKKEGFIKIGDPEVSAYYLPPRGDYPILLWSHGNAENLGTLHNLMDSFEIMGFGILAYDYPGYGETPGSPSEDGCYQAAQTAFAHLTDTLGHKPENIFLCGQSVGTGPTLWLASKHETRGIVLIAPFLSAFRTLTRIPLFPNDRFPNLSRIQEIKTPLLVIHGQNDKVIPHSQGKEIADSSPTSKKTFASIPDAGHNDLFEESASTIFEAFEKFVVETKTSR